MTHPRALGLTDFQLALIIEAAATLPPSERSAFLVGLANRLGEEPVMEAVEHAIAVQLKQNKIPAFVYALNKPRIKMSPPTLPPSDTFRAMRTRLGQPRVFEMIV
jgi:uncharacterized protein (DUF1778 family)